VFRRLDGDVAVGGRGAGSDHSSCNRGGPEALHDQPHAKRELPGSHWDCGESGPPAIEPALPNSLAIMAAMSRGAPMSPSTGMMRGTSRDRYSKVPSRMALMAGMRLCPSRAVQL
jgi:hypothetical protein